MCNRYSVTKGQSAIRDLFDAQDEGDETEPSMEIGEPDAKPKRSSSPS